MNYLNLICGLLIYILAGRVLVRHWRKPAGRVLFGMLNVAGVYWFFFHGNNAHPGVRFGVYFGLLILQYAALRLFSGKQGWWPWLAFLLPVGALVLLRYVPSSVYIRLGVVLRFPMHGIPMMVGISYLAFRSSHLVLQIRNGIVKVPGFWEYAGFCFFVPTLSVGPINPYSNYQRAFENVPFEIPEGRSLLRLMVGLVKYLFLGSVLQRLTYAGLLQDDHYHHWIDLPVAAVFYYLYLYCNFTGFCDMAIGAAGLMGIPVAENFDNPLAARNMKDFWNRWHITLSEYMRDVVFSPLSKYLTRVLGPENVNHAVAGTIIVVFLLIGIWHGVGWNYLMFGAMQALGVVTVHYYTIGLKKWLGRDGFKRYNSNPFIRAAAVTATFSYFAASLFFFANTFLEIKNIIQHLR